MLAAVTMVAAACATSPAPVRPAPDPAPAIRAMLEASAASWNAGDLEGFLDDYHPAPTTAFVGSTVTHGVDEIRRRYQASYWKSGRPAQHLRFEDIDVRPLGTGHALVLGRYVLLTPGTTTVEGQGRFSLVLQQTAEGWKIIHDHSSEIRQ